MSYYRDLARAFMGAFFVVTMSSASAMADVDLTVAKTSSAASVSNGGSLTYSIVITNGGPDAADGATFSDPVPTGYTISGVTCTAAINGAVCPTAFSTANDTVTGTIPTLPANGQVTIEISGVAPSRGQTSISNTVTVAAPTGQTDTDPSTNTASANTTVNYQNVDVAATVQASAASFNVGDTVTYTFTHTNSGSGTADGGAISGLQLEVTPQGNASSIDFSNRTVSCVASGGAVCPSFATPAATGTIAYSSKTTHYSSVVETWPSGGTLTFTVSFDIDGYDALGCGAVDQVMDLKAQAGSGANVYGEAFPLIDSDATNDAADITMSGPSISQSACPSVELSTTKSQSTDNWSFGTPIRYTVTHSNSNNSPADGATISDRMSLSQTDGAVKDLQYKDLTLISCTDSDGGDCSSYITMGAATSTMVNAAAGQMAAYSGTIPVWPAGKSFTVVYEITPVAYTFYPSSTTTPPVCFGTGGTSVGTILNQAQTTKPASLTEDDTSDNTMDVSSQGPGSPMPACREVNIHGTQTVTVNGVAANSFEFGDTVEYTVTWKNVSANNAAGMTVLNYLDSGSLSSNYGSFQIASCTATGGAQCPAAIGSPSATGSIPGFSGAVTGMNFSAAIPEWPQDGEIAVTYRMVPTSYNTTACIGDVSGSINGRALIVNGEEVYDTFFWDGLPAVATVTGPKCVDASVTTTLNPQSPWPGAATTLDIIVTVPSNGAAVTDMVVSDIIPAGFVFDGTSATCTVTSGTGSCGTPAFNWNPTTREFSANIPSMDAGAEITFSLTGAAVNYSSTWPNTATLTYDPAFYDPSPSSNTATINMNITGSDPKLVKQSINKQIIAGDEVQYRISLTNPAGGNPLDNVIIEDTLPTGWTYARTDSVTLSGGATGPTTDPGSEIWGGAGFSVPAGGSVVVVFTAQTPNSLTCGTTPYNNSAKVNFDIGVTAYDRTYDGSAIGASQDDVLVPCAPAISKSYNTTSILTGNNAELTFTITPQAGSTFEPSFDFTDTLPTALKVVGLKANSNTCGGTITNGSGGTLSDGDAAITLSGGTLPNSGADSCTVTFNVTGRAGEANADCSASPAAFTNGASNMSGLVNLTNAVTDQCLRVSLQTGSLRVHKSLSIPSGVSGPFAFDFTANCDGVDYGPVTLTGFPSSASYVDISGIPAGATCTVTEDTTNMPTAPAGYVWGTPTVGTVAPATIPADDISEVTVTNSLDTLPGSLTVTQDLTLPAGVTGPLDFDYTASCDGVDYGPVTLSNYPTNTSVDITNIPAGATCTITQTLPTAPAGFAWGTPSVGTVAPATIPSNGSSAVTVTNTLSQAPGPDITDPDGGQVSALSVPEDQTAVIELQSNRAVTWSLTGGTDQAEFGIDPQTGELVFLTAPDFTSPTDADTDNVYEVEVTATDANGITTTVTIYVTVTEVHYFGQPLPTDEDRDQDGTPDSMESASADRDGDGIVDSQDYDPQGYFYCQADGRILDGGKVTVTGPGNVTMVKDGTTGIYQWYVDAPGEYEMAIDTSGMEFKSISQASAGPMTVASFSGNPVVIGSTETGSTGYLGQYNGVDYDPDQPTAYYTKFVIAAGDANVFGNNIPFKDCATNEVTVVGTTDGREPNGNNVQDGVFTVQMTRPALVDTVITYTLGGTATEGTDYTARTGTITIPAGETSAAITIPVLSDTEAEGTETVVLTLDPIEDGDGDSQTTVSANNSGSINITEGLVDQIRDDLANILEEDMQRAVDAQQTLIEQMPKAALDRLKFGAEYPAQCGGKSAPDLHGAADASRSGVKANLDYRAESYDCIGGRWISHQGAIQITKIGGFGTQYTFSYSRQKERFASETELRGHFIGVYGSQSNVTGKADGHVKGIGLNAGIYGARNFDEDLYIDYYAGGAIGGHGFKLAFPRGDVTIDADGRYTYGALMFGAAISRELGQAEQDETQIFPRLGFDAAFADSLSGTVDATDGTDTESGSFALGLYRKLRLYGEVELRSPSKQDEADENRHWGYSIAPRVICDKATNLSEFTCGYGLSLAISGFDKAEGTSTNLSLMGEHIGASDTIRASVTHRKNVFNGAGAVVSTMGADHNGDLNIDQLLELNF